MKRKLSPSSSINTESKSKALDDAIRQAETPMFCEAFIIPSSFAGNCLFQAVSSFYTAPDPLELRASVCAFMKKHLDMKLLSLANSTIRGLILTSCYVRSSQPRFAHIIDTDSYIAAMLDPKHHGTMTEAAVVGVIFNVTVAVWSRVDEKLPAAQKCCRFKLKQLMSVSDRDAVRINIAFREGGVGDIISGHFDAMQISDEIIRCDTARIGTESSHPPLVQAVVNEESVPEITECSASPVPVIIPVKAAITSSAPTPVPIPSLFDKNHPGEFKSSFEEEPEFHESHPPGFDEAEAVPPEKGTESKHVKKKAAKKKKVAPVSELEARRSKRTKKKKANTTQ